MATIFKTKSVINNRLMNNWYSAVFCILDAHIHVFVTDEEQCCDYIMLQQYNTKGPVKYSCTGAVFTRIINVILICSKFVTIFMTLYKLDSESFDEQNILLMIEAMGRCWQPISL